ncbi:MAG: flavodoxin [Bacteroides sp.]|nr:flavodoxin [Bacteroides sp.]
MIKKILMLLLCFMNLINGAACSNDTATLTDESEITNPDDNAQTDDGAYFGGKRVLIAYFSWGGTTKAMAEEIQRIAGGDLFRIEPVTPYPTDYTECTQVALRERDNDERPAITAQVTDFDNYDVVFIGCPVWWHTAPMIISTFAESYDFTGKTVVPFCTYASTYRDETLQRIVDVTPAAAHLQGLGTTGSVSGVQTWIDLINEQWNEANSRHIGQHER